MKYIETASALKSAGHYRQAIAHGGLLYVSGQLPINPDTGEKVRGNIAAQTRQVFDNIIKILDSEETSIDKILKLVIYISDVNLWGEVNQICGEYFRKHKPVRTIIPISNLHFGLKIEMDCIAICEKNDVT